MKKESKKKKIGLKDYVKWIFIVSLFSFILALVFETNESLFPIFLSICIITLITGMILLSFLITPREIDEQSPKSEEIYTRLVFKGSAGWLLFWLIVVPPIGYLWLIFGMEREEIKE